MATNHWASPALRGRLRAIGLPVATLDALISTGLTEEDAEHVLDQRLHQGYGVDTLDADVATLAATADPELLLRAVNDAFDTRDLQDNDGTIDADADEITACLDLGINYDLLCMWTTIGRDITSLRNALTPDNSPPARALICAVTGGADIEDVHWLHAGLRGQGWIGIYQLSANLREPAARDARRLALAFAAHAHPQNRENISEIATANAGTPWLETLTCLALDGVPIAQAPAIAQAEHELHTRQQRRITTTLADASKRAATPPAISGRT